MLKNFNGKVTEVEIRQGEKPEVKIKSAPIVYTSSSKRVNSHTISLKHPVEELSGKEKTAYPLWQNEHRLNRTSKREKKERGNMAALTPQFKNKTCSQAMRISSSDLCRFFFFFKASMKNASHRRKMNQVTMLLLFVIDG